MRGSPTIARYLQARFHAITGAWPARPDPNETRPAATFRVVSRTGSLRCSEDELLVCASIAIGRCQVRSAGRGRDRTVRPAAMKRLDMETLRSHNWP
jgi:hypothetical protein